MIETSMSNPEDALHKTLRIEDELSVGWLGLSIRVRNSLIRAGLGSVGSVRRARLHGSLAGIRNMGTQGLLEVDRALDNLVLPQGTGRDGPAPPSWTQLVEPCLTASRLRSMRVLVRRFAHEPATLDEIGKALGLTRERVRQLERLAIRTIGEVLATGPGASFIARFLDTASALGDSLSSSSLKRSMQTSNHLGEWLAASDASYQALPDPFDILLAFLVGAQKLGGGPAIPFDATALLQSGSRSVHHLQLIKQVPKKAIRKVIRKAKFTGGIELSDAAKLLGLAQVVSSLALTQLGFQRQSSNWHWLAAKSRHQNSPIRHAGLKMLSVARSVLIQDFQDGVRRHIARHYSALAPTACIESTLSLLGFTVVDDRVFGEGQPNSLSPTETRFFEIASTLGPVITHSEIAEGLMSSGLSLASVSMLLSRSPIVRKIDYGLYALRGTEVDRTQIERARSRVDRVSSDVTTSHGLDGILHVQLSLGSWGAHSGVIAAAQIPRIRDGWPIFVGASNVGTVASDGTLLWGLGKALSILSVQIGDRIELAFNTHARTVHVTKVLS